MALIAEVLKGKMGPGLGGKGMKDAPENEEAEDDIGGEAGTRAAEDLVSAVKAGSATSVLAAFKRLYEHCQGQPEEAEEE